MSRRYTVVWSPSADRRMGELWLANPAIQREFTQAVNDIEEALQDAPELLGEPTPSSPRIRLVVRPPISLLFSIRPDDCLVRVLACKLWDED